MKRIRIANEDVRLYPEEMHVLQTPAFQRLFLLKQLGLAYLVYPSATHTRGAHSLRCLSETSRILASIQKDDTNRCVVSEEESRVVRMTALLHDIGHIPFSHTLEDEHAVLPKHDKGYRLQAALDLVRQAVPKATLPLIDAAQPILRTIGGDVDTPPDWRSDVVGNTICADLLAYIYEDALWTGIEKRPGHYRIYEYFRLHNNRLCIKLTKGGLRTDIVSAIMDLLDMRYALTERVLFHHAKCVASSMLARAARLAGLTDSPRLLLLGDEGFVQHLQKKAHKRERGAEHLIEGLQARKLHKRIFKISRDAADSWDRARHPGAFSETWRSADHVEALLCRVEDDNRLPRGSLSLWCPDLSAGMKLARAQVVWESAEGLEGPVELRDPDGIGKRFPGVAQRVATIEEQYLDLWAFWVTLDRTYLERTYGVVRGLQEELGIECDAVFRETHLRHIEGYDTAVTVGRQISNVVNEIRSEAEQTVRHHAAYGKGQQADGATVREAVAEAAKNTTSERGPSNRGRKSTPPSEAGPRLPLDGQPDMTEDE